MAMTQYGMPPAYRPERAYHTSPAAYALGGNGYTAPMVRAQSQPLDRVVPTTTADNLEQVAAATVPAEIDWWAPTWEDRMGMRGLLQQHPVTQHPPALSNETGRSTAPPYSHAPTQGVRGQFYSPPPVTGPYHYETRNGLLAAPAAPCFASRLQQAKPSNTSMIYPDPHAIPAPIKPVFSGYRPIIKSKATVADAIRRFEASMGNTGRVAHHRHPTAVPASRGWRSVRRVLDYAGAGNSRSVQQIDRNNGQIARLSQSASRGAMIRPSAVLGSPFIPRRMPARRRRVWGADRWQEAAEYVHEQQAVVQQQQQLQGQADEVAGTEYDSEEEDYDSDFSSELDPSDYRDDASSVPEINEQQRIPPIAADACAPVPFIFMPPMPYRAPTCRDLSGWAYGAAVRSMTG